jgi:hypothetical protein
MLPFYESLAWAALILEKVSVGSFLNGEAINR